MTPRSFSGVAAAAACALLLAGCQSLGHKPPPIPPPGAAAPVTEAPAPAGAPTPAEPSPAAAADAKARYLPRALSKAPRYPDTDAALRDAGGAADRYQLMAAGRLLRMRRLAELERAIDGCR